MRDKKLANKFKGLPCIVCGSPGNGDHILNYKRIPSRDKVWNMWSLCPFHHREKTDFKRGLSGFVSKYKLEQKLKDKGFYFIEENKKWWHKNG